MKILKNSRLGNFTLRMYMNLKVNSKIVNANYKIYKSILKRCILLYIHFKSKQFKLKIQFTHISILSRFVFLILLACYPIYSQKTLIPMDNTQANHLKAYGIAFLAIQSGVEVEWLLNYRGGSFLLGSNPVILEESALRGVTMENVTSIELQDLEAKMTEENREKIKLDKAPKIAVYTPPNKQPWDDAVTLVLTYAEIPYTPIYDTEVIQGKLKEYDWLHLHHEDFTGQLSKFYRNFSNAPWYIEQRSTLQNLAENLGFSNIVELKKGVALSIRDYIEQGGFLFAMCLAGNTLDIALSASRTDIVPDEFDGTPVDPHYSQKLDFGLSLAFENFTLDTDPLSGSHGNIDYNQVNSNPLEKRPANPFLLKDFSSKFDPVPSMLNQNHTHLIPGFFGLATSFRSSVVKKSVTILAETDGQPSVRYLHGNVGKGQFTYLGGHDPEDESHAVGDPPTDLDRYRNSAGYRLILNNVLYPAARKKKQKT